MRLSRRIGFSGLAATVPCLLIVATLPSPHAPGSPSWEMLLAGFAVIGVAARHGRTVVAVASGHLAR